MMQHERYHRFFALAVLIIVTISTQGCVSVQVSSADGKPKLIGFGHAKAVNGREGQIYQIVAPGLSLRVHSYAPGLSLGWQETKLFFPSTNGQPDPPNRPVAIQNRCVGIDFAPSHIMLGYQRSFAIPLPLPGRNVIQYISYLADNPTNTVVERKEIK